MFVVAQSIIQMKFLILNVIKYLQYASQNIYIYIDLQKYFSRCHLTSKDMLPPLVRLFKVRKFFIVVIL